MCYKTEFKLFINSVTSLLLQFGFVPSFNDNIDGSTSIALPLQVNKDFGSIFSTLLPGATAKLAPLQGCGVLEGLEFKVALGTTWKENLSELSGGQRSAGTLHRVTRVFFFLV